LCIFQKSILDVMMRKFINLGLALILTSCAVAQERKQTYQFSEDILKQIDADTTAWKYQLGATDLSFSGYYNQALQIWLKNGARTPQRLAIDSSFYSKSVKNDAKAYIIERSKKEEIIVINEAHHNPMHRVFTASLLKELYQNGYRYLGLEALADTAINDRKFATNDSGFYTKEPQFGNLIAEALRFGYTVFGYEATAGKNGKEREIEQARNIERFVKNNPKGKLLIHCGFSHVFENEYKPWEKAMAGRLKEYLDIDPFTIDQELYTERGPEAYNPLFVNLNTSGKPIVLSTESGEVFAGQRKPNQTDIVIIHPQTELLNGRAHWLQDGKLKVTIDEKYQKKHPLLALAYRDSESSQNGIPADIVEILEENSPNYFYLKPGKYEIVIKDKFYGIISTYTKVVK
jgi:hypothetical protein